ncbi:TonB-dependent receptor [Shinella daejeonensis]|uniref:TonB-dependent receptor plug domain-containing protein n=1 Tax=Shinella daejeonensis TaxID=659017 RepID=UPI0020C75087|nr:TonB-dependent receptor [Shinella daejeonensis]MCP8895140.1 TonB-dependent receptor [Shinella daejeonensis]
MRIHLAGASLLTIAICSPALAQDRPAAAEPTDLDAIVITDGLTSVDLRKSGRAVTVITGEQIEKNHIRYVADALRLVPGFAVSRMGSYGGLSQVRVRGAEGNHVLVVIDGVEVNDNGTGEFDFSSLIADDIERIEILRGPQSTFWGANAMAGVINIVTKRGERDSATSTARTETGTDGTWLGALSTRGGGETYDYALSGTFRRSSGFNIANIGREDDGDRNATLNGKFTVDISPDTTIDGTLRYVNRRGDTDPQDFDTAMAFDAADYIKTRELFGSLGLTNTALDGALTQKARISANDIHRFNHSGLFGDSWDDGNRYNATYQASYRFDDLENQVHQLTAGYEWQRETFSPSHLNETFSRRAHSLVGEYRGEFLDQFYLNGGLRQDWNDAFANAATWTVSGAWQIPGAHTRLHASIGTAVTNPTFYEQFGYFPGAFIGNPNLRPEESRGWDIGVEQRFFDGELIVDVTYFNQNLKSEIATVSDANFNTTAVNLDGTSKRQGVEVAATVDFFNGFTATAAYTYTDASEQSTAGGPRQAEVRRPRHAGSVNAAYVFDEGRARVFAEAIFNGKMEDAVFATLLPPRVPLAGYTVVNIGGSYKLNETVEIFGRIDNLFDRDYQEVYGYNAPGLAAFAGVKATF